MRTRRPQRKTSGDATRPRPACCLGMCVSDAHARGEPGGRTCKEVLVDVGELDVGLCRVGDCEDVDELAADDL